jgi:hypothetical protein
MTNQQALLSIERALWNGGPEAYRDNLDSECLMAFTDMAGLVSKASIADMAEDDRWSDVLIEPKGFVEMTDDSAVLTYHAAATRKNGDTYRALVSSAYVKRPEGWKLAFHSQTPEEKPHAAEDVAIA